MKKVWLRVSECVTIDVAAKHLESLGYKNVWGDFRPKSPNAIVGERNGEISWDTDLDFLTNDSYQEIFIPITKHKHYDLIVKWATDTTQKVWWKSPTGWKQIDQPTWGDKAEYHIGEHPPKRKITIGDVEINAPEVVGLKHGQGYYIPIINGQNVTWAEFTWHNAQHQFDLLKRGLVHLNKEAAIAHAKALIKVSGGCVDE